MDSPEQSFSRTCDYVNFMLKTVVWEFGVHCTGHGLLMLAMLSMNTTHKCPLFKNLSMATWMYQF